MSDLIAQAELDALTARLNALADPMQTAVSAFADTDWRSLAYRCAATIAELRAQSQPPASEPFTHLVRVKTKDAGWCNFFTAPSDPRGFPVYRHPDPRVAELERDLAAARAEVEALRLVINGHVTHDYMGMCPDETDWSARDPECQACQMIGPFVAAKESGNG